MTLSPLQRGLVIAAVQVLVVSTLGVKLLIDRATLPRVWVATAPVDPDLPIRGRYVQLRLQVPLAGEAPQRAGGDETRWRPTHPIALEFDGERYVARMAYEWTGRYAWINEHEDGAVAVLTDTIPFFIPEDVADPSIRPSGETLWVEVTVPRKGLPRPIRLGVQRGEAPVEPLSLR